MLNTANLSLEQAPPISIPFRFFLTAPLFGMIAGIFLLVYGGELLQSRWTASTLGVTHLITLGFVTMVMCGALMQMLPVLAGSPLPQIKEVGASVHLFLSIGTLCLVSAFLFDITLWMPFALAALATAFLIFLTAVTIALFRVKLTTMTVLGMRLAVAALGVTLLFGLVMGSGYAGLMTVPYLALLTDMHLGWGLLGWFGLLLIAVSYQIVPMFQVTPEYPLLLRHRLISTLFFGLIIWSLLKFGVGMGALYAVVPEIWLSLLFVGYTIFALVTLYLQSQRRRRIVDVTLLFWRTGLVATVFCLLLWGVAQWFPAVGSSSRYPMLLGVGVLLGAVLSFVNGMLYKIVPFLAWFHLQNRQLALMCMTVPVPNMKELIPDRQGRVQYLAHLCALVLLVAALFLPQWFSRPAALLFLLSNILLLVNLALASKRYRQTYQALIANS